MQQKKYHKYIIWIHWFSALLIFGLIFTGIKMEHQALSIEKFNLYKIHFLLGILVLIATVLRIIAILKYPKPIALYPINSPREKFRNLVYKGFYIILLWMCISGLISLFGEGIFTALQSGKLSDLPEIKEDGFHPIMLSHHVVAKLFFLLLIFHICGVIVHFIQKKENALHRIS